MQHAQALFHIIVRPSKEECPKRRRRATDADQVGVVQILRDAADDVEREHSAFCPCFVLFA
jgi:hypothetical protein